MDTTLDKAYHSVHSRTPEEREYAREIAKLVRDAKPGWKDQTEPTPLHSTKGGTVVEGAAVVRIQAHPSEPTSSAPPAGTVEVFLSMIDGELKNVEFYIGEITDP